MLYSVTDPESYITEHTLVYEDEEMVACVVFVYSSTLSDIRHWIGLGIPRCGGGGGRSGRPPHITECTLVYHRVYFGILGDSSYTRIILRTLK